MQLSEEVLSKVEAELCVPVASAQIWRFHLEEPADNLLRDDDAYRIDMCLTPRMHNARACYREHWAPHRFERIGKIFLLPPRETVCARSDCGRQTSIVCRLQPERIRDWLERDLEWTDRGLEASLDVSDANVRRVLLRIAEEVRQPGFASEMLVELMSVQMAIELSRYCSAINEMAIRGGLAPWRLRLIDEKLRELGATPTLAELAALCGLSVRQLTRGFRASRHCSIGDYVANNRLDHAKRLLATEQSVKTIAYSVGFASPSSFCFAFRRATGSTPRQYRHQILRDGKTSANNPIAAPGNAV